MAVLTLGELKATLHALPGWESHEKTLVKTFRLPSFTAAIILIGAIAQVAEATDHHPDLNLHNYNQLTMTLSTHSEGGVTMQDVQLAEQIQAIPRRVQQ